MQWIRYSIGNTRAQGTMPLSIGAPQVHASGKLAGVNLIDPHTATVGPILLSLASGAIVRLRVKRRAGADTHYTMPEGSSLTIRGKL